MRLNMNSIYLRDSDGTNVFRIARRAIAGSPHASQDTTDALRPDTPGASIKGNLVQFALAALKKSQAVNFSLGQCQTARLRLGHSCARFRSCSWRGLGAAGPRPCVRRRSSRRWTRWRRRRRRRACRRRRPPSPWGGPTGLRKRTKREINDTPGTRLKASTPDTKTRKQVRLTYL